MKGIGLLFGNFFQSRGSPAGRNFTEEFQFQLQNEVTMRQFCLMLLLFLSAPVCVWAQLQETVSLAADGCQRWEKVSEDRKVTQQPIETYEDLAAFYAPNLKDGQEVYDRPVHRILRDSNLDPSTIYQLIRNKQLRYEAVPAVNRFGERRKYFFSAFANRVTGEVLTTPECVTAYWAEPELIWQLLVGDLELDTPRDGGNISLLARIVINYDLVTLKLTIKKTNDGDGDGFYTKDGYATKAKAAVPFRYEIKNESPVALRIKAITEVVDNVQPVAICAEYVGRTLAPTEGLQCNKVFDGYSPEPGQSKVNTVTITAEQTNDPSNVVTASDDSTIKTQPILNITFAESVQSLSAEGIFFADGVRITPGQLVRYRIVVRSDGSNASSQLLIKDVLDRCSSYVPRTLRINGLLGTSAQEGELFSGGTNLDLAPDATRILTFDVQFGKCQLKLGEVYEAVNYSEVAAGDIARRDAATVIMSPAEPIRITATPPPANPPSVAASQPPPPIIIQKNPSKGFFKRQEFYLPVLFSSACYGMMMMANLNYGDHQGVLWGPYAEHKVRNHATCIGSGVAPFLQLHFGK